MAAAIPFLVHFRRSPCARAAEPHLLEMHPPIFVREPSSAERTQLEAGLRAASAFTVRRAQIVLLSAAGRPPRAIAQGLCCAVQTVRNAIRAFNSTGLAALTAGSPRPKSAAPRLDRVGLEQLRAILHQSPRVFGQARSTWTLALLAQVAHAVTAALAQGAECHGPVAGDDPACTAAAGGGLEACQALADQPRP
jgi:transposase